MEKRVNYAISGQNLDIVTKTSDKNLLILTQVCITAELFWKLERIAPETHTYIFPKILLKNNVFRLNFEWNIVFYFPHSFLLHFLTFFLSKKERKKSQKKNEK